MRERADNVRPAAYRTKKPYVGTGEALDMRVARYREFVVTQDNELLEKLWARFSELGTFGLATYAYSLGLYPPGYEEGQLHSITAVGFSDTEPECLVWSIGLDRPDPTYLDQAREEGDDDDDEFDDGTIWGELFPDGLQHIDDTKNQ